MSTTISRLRAANPAPVQIDRGQSVAAREALERILSEPHPEAHRRRRRVRSRLPRGGVAVVIALGLAGGGAAVAATNPFGWWSSNPDSAKFELNPAAHARTPGAYAIGCRAVAGGLVCAPARLDSLGRPHARGQLYLVGGAVQQVNPPGLFTRVHFLRALGKLPPAEALKLRRDLARVPNSFFTELRIASRFQTYGSGQTDRMPPPGIPEILTCEQVPSGLSCQDLNGDRAAPIGAGVYFAQPAADWQPAPPQRPDYGLPPGIHFTRAEYQVLFDLARFAGTTHASGSTRIHAVRARSS